MYVKIAAPDIPDFPNGFPGFWVKTIFIRRASPDYQVSVLAETYVRLIEAALLEYREGVAKLRLFWNDGSFNRSAMMRSTSHFESCLSDIYRASNAFRRLRSHRARDPLSIELCRDRPLFNNESIAARFREIRHAIHHLDDRLMNGTINPGQPIALMPDGPEVAHPTEPNQTIKTIDRLQIGSCEVLFTDLVAWLSEMARYADRIATFEPPKPG